MVLICFLLLAKHDDQKHIGGDDLFRFLLAGHCPSLREVGTGTQSRSIEKQRRNTLWLSPSAWCSAAFLTHSGPPALGGRHCPQWAGPSHINQQSRQLPTDINTGQWDPGNASLRAPAPSQVALECSKLTVKTSWTARLWDPQAKPEPVVFS